MTDQPLSAYIDESTTSRGDGTLPLYVLTALVIPDSDARETRKAIRSVAPISKDGVAYFHSNRAKDQDRGMLLAKVFRSSSSSAFVTSLVVDSQARFSEQARQSCIAELLVHGNEIGVTSFVFDSRLDTRRHVTDPAAKNRNDIRTLQKLQQLNLVDGNAAIRHIDDKLEPLIWAADCVAWVVRRGLQYDEVGLAPYFVHKLELLLADTNWSQTLPSGPTVTRQGTTKAGGSQSSNQTRPSMPSSESRRSRPDDHVDISSQKHKETSIANQAIIDDYLTKCRTARNARLRQPSPAAAPNLEALPPLGVSQPGSTPSHSPGL